MTTHKFTFTVRVNEAGHRLDQLLVQRHPARSRSQWAVAIRSNWVLVDSKPAKAKHLLRRGQRVTVTIPRLKPPQIKVERLPVIYQNNNFLVINKPAGLVMHPSGRHQTGTVLDLLAAQFPEAYLVHRLDKDTSGVVVVAKNLKTKEFLSRLFAQRTIKKTYLALVVGQLTPRQAYLDLPIIRGRSGKFEVGIKGRSAKSLYKVIEYLPGYSLIEVHPESGRTHQIRVHLKALKHPVAGDEMYNKKTPGLSRQFLHATKIEFVDVAGQPQSFSASLPPELNKFLDELRQK